MPWDNLVKSVEEAKMLSRLIDYDYLDLLDNKFYYLKGLNKGEAMNALARAVFFGKHGEFREHALQDQLQRASVLNILINAISV